MLFPYNTSKSAFDELIWPRKLLVLLTVLTTGWYLSWRLTTFNPAAPIFSWALFLAECFGYLTLLMHLLMLWRLTKREAPQPEEGHSVDVFITTINEPLKIVRRTVLTALAMDYPHRVYILDDGNRVDMRNMASELHCGYITRNNNLDAKAGNLNNALAHTEGAFILILDADHAPKKTFLTHTLGYFRDPLLAFVQTPQDFYNLDSYQHRKGAGSSKVWSEQSLFFRVIQRGKDYWNACFFCGSCAIVRRTALDEIGGFATGTVTEDIHTSIRLHKAGWRSVYHAESLAFGIAAAQVEPFLRQRIRWGQGAMQVWRQEGIIFNRRLTIAQKICYAASMVTYFDGWQKLIFYITPAIVLFTSVMPLIVTTEDFLWHFIPYFLLMMWSFEELGRGYGRTLIIEQYNMARFAAFAYATFGLFRSSKLSFRVTNKKLGDNPFLLFLLPQVFILSLNLVAVPVGILYSMMDFHHQQLSPFATAANIFWAIINFSLAAAILRFSMQRALFKRQNYRFSIPLVGHIHHLGNEAEDLYVAIHNIDSVGVMMYLPSSISLPVDTILRCSLFLPDGIMPISAAVKSPNRINFTDSLRQVGCRIIWEDNAQMDRLERFLYGSNLEWRLQCLSERSKTPMERVLGQLDDERYPNLLYDSSYLFSMLYQPQANKTLLKGGYITMDHQNHPNNIIVFEPVTAGSLLELQYLTGQGWQSIHARIEESGQSGLSTESLYHYSLKVEI